MEAGVRLVLLQLQIETVNRSLFLAYGAGRPIHGRKLDAGRHLQTAKSKHLVNVFNGELSCGVLILKKTRRFPRNWPGAGERR